MSFTAEDYLAQAKALLPRGWAWVCGSGSRMHQLLRGVACEFARVDGRLVDLRNEADPRTTLELLPDWERFVGLPDGCVYEVATTLEARRAALQAKLLATGGASRQYFIDLCTAYGYPGATIDESAYDEAIQPATCNGTCNDSLWSDDVRFNWTLNLPGTGGSFIMGCNDTCNDYLQVYGEPNSIECRINQVKPAHTTVYFTYAEGPG